MTFCDDPGGYHEHGCPGYLLERIAISLEAIVAEQEREREAGRVLADLHQRIMDSEVRALLAEDR